MGTFTREQAWSYLLAFLAWLGGWVSIVLRYAGHDIGTTPVQGIRLAAMLGACAIMIRSAWVLTRASEGPPPAPGSPFFVRFLSLFSARTSLMLLGVGVPAAVRAVRGKDSPR